MYTLLMISGVAEAGGFGGRELTDKGLSATMSIESRNPHESSSDRAKRYGVLGSALPGSSATLELERLAPLAQNQPFTSVRGVNRRGTD